uniref:CCHC-type domain-containing protein n=1 Tax=Glossina austeni TaxID=7395 RepID=A0A1A9VG80_GLOAU
MQQKINRIYRNSPREYQLIIDQSECVNLTDMISLAEHYGDIPPEQSQAGHHRPNAAMEPISPPSPDNGIRRRNVCHRCNQEGHYAQHCQNPRILFCWECGRRGVLTKDCSRQNIREQSQASGIRVKETIAQREPLSGAPKTIISTVGNTLIASLTVGGLTTTGVVDTGATRSIIRKDMIGFIPHIIATKASSNTIQMADGSLRDSKQMITVEVYAGHVSFNLELLVLVPVTSRWGWIT